MRKWIFGSVLLVLTSPSSSHAVEPKAVINGPESVTLGTEPDGIIRIVITGTVSDRHPKVQWQSGPETIEPDPRFDKKGNLVCFEVKPTKPGTFEFVNYAIGEAADPDDEKIHYAVLTVIVKKPGQAPTPPQQQPQSQPDNSEQPPPAPEVLPPRVPRQLQFSAPPPPPPVPVTVIQGPLYAVLIGSNMTPADSQQVEKALADLQIAWMPLEFGNVTIKNLHLDGYLTGRDGKMTLLIYDKDGFYTETGKRAGVATAAIDPPASLDDLVKLFVKLRGR